MNTSIPVYSIVDWTSQERGMLRADPAGYNLFALTQLAANTKTKSLSYQHLKVTNRYKQKS
jgi:hypothetical protein